MEKKSMKVVVGEEEITFETGQIARQANGAVVVKSGETMLFCSACATAEPLENVDFLPLRVDYQEKFASAGKTLGGFIKREGRPTERETLVCRLIDRPIRPLFEEGYYQDTQLLSYVWSYDGVNSPDALAICAASAALTISDIPLKKAVGAVRVGMIDGQFILNPTVEHQEKSVLDLMIAGTEDAVLMIEGYCKFLTEEQVIEAISIGHQGIQTICRALENWRQEVGKPKNLSKLKPLAKEVIDAVEELVKDDLNQVLQIVDKKEREEAFDQIKKRVNETLCPEGEEVPKFEALEVAKAFKKVSSGHMRRMIVKENKRSDGRATNQVRPIWIEQGLLPRTHGCSLFTRGETQTVAICTLGGNNMAQRYEDLNGEGSRSFYLQYFFPPFSVGEVGRVGPPGRREVGHGKLAERALASILPSKEEFPYTIRLESNITESNGSSSMASVCGGCLAMMDAGVPITRPVSGIAMGLILEENHYTILSDILGIEDALGDMDFKVTGDKNGITAFQMDIKVEGITIDIMRAALAQAKEGRIHILEKMFEACPEPKKQMSKYAPRIEVLKVKPSKIGTIIGPGGKQIRAIIEETGAEIDIDDEGFVTISSSNLDGLQKAKRIIEDLTAEVEIGKVYEGKITSVVPFGIFVEILPGKEGLCHISEFDTQRTNDLNEVVKVGDNVRVKVMDINERGQLVLSRKVLLVSK
ncbi:polyribonucleotide nucleotidyltransferase [Waddlia chondrophila 2032/99]|uniref:Polyribonucleotide nucleotidyltransferase n=1 Tax=Waddlia chondrophila 2032/99 TaxID=765953 RepID=F8LAE0_9BACT|nr:polyribonucleotide nucleotidyltransferase [Waddlia chondrophila 2032/99]